MSQEQDLFITADQALLQVVQQIQDEQWDKKITEPLAAGKDLTLKQLIQYHAYDEAWVPDILAGKTLTEVGDIYSGDLLGTDPKAAFAALVAKALIAVQALTDADLDKTIHFSYGDFLMREGLVHIATFRGFRVYTISRYLGIDTTMPTALVDHLTNLVVPHVEDWRAMGVFGPAIPVPADADQQTKLLGITGFLQ